MASFNQGKMEPAKYLGYNISLAKVNDEYKYWNKNTSRVRSIEPDMMAEINKKISSWETAFADYISECNLKETAPDVYKFRGTLIGTLKTNDKKTKNTPTLLSVIDLYITSIKETHDARTVQKYDTIRINIENYEKEIKSTVFVSHVNKEWYKQFCLYLANEENNHNAILNRKQGHIITCINYFFSTYRDLAQSIQPYSDYNKRYTLKTVKAPKFPLFPEELATLRAYTPHNDFHAMVLDAFLLACETGLRYSDIEQLQAGHIHSHIAGDQVIKYISLNNIKGDDINNMPLSNNAISILDRYSVEEGCIFPFSHSQVVSKTLKKILAHKDVNINRPCEVVTIKINKTKREMQPLHNIISFHTARNTYITRLLSANLAPAFVKDNVGHSDIETTMGYFRNDDIARWTATLGILNK